MQEIVKTAEQILELIKEAEQYHKYQSGLSKRLTALFHDYQKGKHTYFEYKDHLSKIVKGKSKRDWEEYYASYLYQVLKKIELLNDKLFYSIYDDSSFEKLAVGKHFKIKETSFNVPESKEKDKQKEAKVKHKKDGIPRPSIEDEKVASKTKVPHPTIGAEKQPFFVIAAAQQVLHWLHIKRKKPTSEYVLEGTKKLFKFKEEPIFGENMEVPAQAIKFRRKPLIAFEEFEVPKSAIAEEASRIKKILSHREELVPYKPSFFGTMANITIRKASFYLIDSFPEFFRYLYNSLRLANIKILSNTYVNVMVFFSIISTIISLPIFIIFFNALANPVFLTIIKSLLLSIVVGIITFFGFYYYPFGKISQRAKNIKTNLPFAINHMAAVAASGVSPVKMFKLISKSKEYGEISIEVEKVVEYVELFGYDFLTALKSVSATTPSDIFKEYLDGMVSNIESGSDLKVYMNEKSKEALLEYELERQKYAETISTYSDIYTGILIAAPLFFVAALSLVSILGGVVGGIPIDRLIVLGTYIIIPLLNVGFIIFLQFTQPEV